MAKTSASEGGAVIGVGRKAPSFELPGCSGEAVSLIALLSKAPAAVVYFYPRADTEGCTKEACGFRNASAEYAKLKVPVVGISPDPVKAVTKFAQKYNLGFPLLADEDHKVAEAYGVWQEKSMYGRKYLGVMRTTFVIGKDGKVLHVFENVKPLGHDARVLAWLRENL
jgi:peroxiredoxin Q/BCP